MVLYATCDRTSDPGKFTAPSPALRHGAAHILTCSGPGPSHAKVLDLSCYQPGSISAIAEDVKQLVDIPSQFLQLVRVLHAMNILAFHDIGQRMISWRVGHDPTRALNRLKKQVRPACNDAPRRSIRKGTSSLERFRIKFSNLPKRMAFSGLS